ncbi:MAG: hypothetical protein PXY39_06545 [archaeon]|jgi:hypothetical protein|nr:hypothetical protein [archaeon]
MLRFKRGMQVLRFYTGTVIATSLEIVLFLRIAKVPVQEKRLDSTTQAFWFPLCPKKWPVAYCDLSNQLLDSFLEVRVNKEFSAEEPS